MCLGGRVSTQIRSMRVADYLREPVGLESFFRSGNVIRTLIRHFSSTVVLDKSMYL